MIEINFDGLVGPTHNFAGLSFGNVASALNAGDVSRPREAALQGLAKMRVLMDRGLVQGFLPPPRRPAAAQLRRVGFRGSDRDVLEAAAVQDPALFVKICSASAMWAANAATVIAAPDSGDGRAHLVTANLATMLHRRLEAEDNHRLLSTIFADERYFVVHPPLPFERHFSDEGAANHMRLATDHGAPGLNIFVYGEQSSHGYPARQNRRTGEAVARFAGTGSSRVRHERQAEHAIAAGAFHNDVVAVANENVLFAHVDAFADRADLLDWIDRHIPQAVLIEVDDLPLADAISTYLFNSQIVTLPDGGGMALVLPAEVGESAAAWEVVERVLAGNNPIDEAIVVDVRGSMRNGGGPACLRLRVPVSDEAIRAIDPRFLLDARRHAALVALVDRYWPQQVRPGDLTDPGLWAECAAAHDALDGLLTS